MKASLLASFRAGVILFALLPILTTVVLVGFVEVSGRFFLDSVSGGAAGIVLVASVLPLVAAHVSLLSAVLGSLLLPFGYRKDRPLVMAIIAGFLFSIFVLHRIYLW